MIQEKERERDSRYEMRLITSEMKDQLNWVPNPNNSQEERERENGKENNERENEKKHEWKEWKEVSGNVVPSVDANSNIYIYMYDWLVQLANYRCIYFLFCLLSFICFRYIMPGLVFIRECIFFFR